MDSENIYNGLPQIDLPNPIDRLTKTDEVIARIVAIDATLGQNSENPALTQLSIEELARQMAPEVSSTLPFEERKKNFSAYTARLQRIAEVRKGIREITTPKLTSLRILLLNAIGTQHAFYEEKRGELDTLQENARQGLIPELFVTLAEQEFNHLQSQEIISLTGRAANSPRLRMHPGVQEAIVASMAATQPSETDMAQAGRITMMKEKLQQAGDQAIINGHEILPGRQSQVKELIQLLLQYQELDKQVARAVIFAHRIHQGKVTTKEVQNQFEVIISQARKAVQTIGWTIEGYKKEDRVSFLRLTPREEPERGQSHKAREEEENTNEIILNVDEIFDPSSNDTKEKKLLNILVSFGSEQDPINRSDLIELLYEDELNTLKARNLSPNAFNEEYIKFIYRFENTKRDLRNRLKRHGFIIRTVALNRTQPARYYIDHLGLDEEEIIPTLGTTFIEPPEEEQAFTIEELDTTSTEKADEEDLYETVQLVIRETDRLTDEETEVLKAVLSIAVRHTKIDFLSLLHKLKPWLLSQASDRIINKGQGKFVLRPYNRKDILQVFYRAYSKFSNLLSVEGYRAQFTPDQLQILQLLNKFTDQYLHAQYDLKHKERPENGNIKTEVRKILTNRISEGVYEFCAHNNYSLAQLAETELRI